MTEKLNGKEIEGQPSNIVCSFRFVEDIPGYFDFRLPVELDRFLEEGKTSDDFYSWLTLMEFGLPPHRAARMREEFRLLVRFFVDWEDGLTAGTVVALNKEKAKEQLQRMNKRLGQYFNVVMEEWK